MKSIVMNKNGVMDALYNKMLKTVAERNHLSIKQVEDTFSFRFGWAEDWNKLKENEYVYDWSIDGDHKQFVMLPVTFECIGIFGWTNGNSAGTVNNLKVFLNEKKVRDWPGYLLNIDLDNKTEHIFIDPVYVTKGNKLTLIVNTKTASSKSEAFPLFWVIERD